MKHNTLALFNTTLVNRISNDQAYDLYYKHFLPLLENDPGYKALFNTKDISEHDLMNYIDKFIDKRVSRRSQTFFKSAPQPNHQHNTLSCCVIL